MEKEQHCASVQPEQTQETEQDSLSQRQVRIEKLQQLQTDGNDPYGITKFDVTEKSTHIKADYEVAEAKCIEEANGDDELLQEKLNAL